MNFFLHCVKIWFTSLGPQREIMCVYWFDYVLHDVVVQPFSLRVFVRPHTINKSPIKW